MAQETSATSNELVMKHGSPSLQMAFLNCVGLTQLFLGEWASGRIALDAGRAVAERFGYEFYLALIDDDLAQLHSASGDWERAHSLLDRALMAPAMSDDPYCRSLALCHTGTTSRRSGDAESAIDWYSRAVAAADGTAAHYAFLNARTNLTFGVGGAPSGQQALAEIAQRARDLDLLFIALKADFFAATLLYRDGEKSAALDKLAECIPQQLELGHLNFLVQELVLEPEMALDFVHARAEMQVAQALVELVARHWGGMPLLIACLALDPVAGVAAVKAAVAHRDEAEITSILAKASRSPIPEVRRAVTSLRRARRKAPREQLDDRLDLTSREIQILGLMADGAMNADIARDLVLAPATVKTHVNHIFSKLGVHDRVQAVLRYRSTTAGSAAPGSASTSRARRTTKDTTVG